MWHISIQHPMGLLYSAHPTITRKQLHDPDFDTTTIDQWSIRKVELYMDRYNIKRLTQSDTEYHYKFHSIYSKPQIIYYIWNLNLLNNQILWVVWPRKATEYWRQVVTDLIQKASDFHITTISWLAEGIDSQCHWESIVYGVPTISVLWWWLKYFYDNKKHRLQKIIWNWWLILSEFKLWFKPTSYSFPQRNRIIAGLADIIFLPEASEKSGSLITVDFALQAKKQVFSTPNDIYNIHSTWVNKYISEKKIQAIYDIPLFLKSHFMPKEGISSAQSSIPDITLEDVQKNIISLLRQADKTNEQLLQETWLDISQLSTHLSLLEIYWLIYQKNNGIYSSI